MERGDHEEEAGSLAGEHVKSHELLKQNLDSKKLNQIYLSRVVAYCYLVNIKLKFVFHIHSVNVCYLRKACAACGLELPASALVYTA